MTKRWLCLIPLAIAGTVAPAWSIPPPLPEIERLRLFNGCRPIGVSASAERIGLSYLDLRVVAEEKLRERNLYAKQSLPVEELKHSTFLHVSLRMKSKSFFMILSSFLNLTMPL